MRNPFSHTNLVLALHPGHRLKCEFCEAERPYLLRSKGCPTARCSMCHFKGSPLAWYLDFAPSYGGQFQLNPLERLNHQGPAPLKQWLHDLRLLRGLFRYNSRPRKPHYGGPKDEGRNLILRTFRTAAHAASLCVSDILNLTIENNSEKQLKTLLDELGSCMAGIRESSLEVIRLEIVSDYAFLWSVLLTYHIAGRFADTHSEDAFLSGEISALTQYNCITPHALND